jgi:hypothetical protein
MATPKLPEGRHLAADVDRLQDRAGLPAGIGVEPQIYFVGPPAAKRPRANRAPSKSVSLPPAVKPIAWRKVPVALLGPDSAQPSFWRSGAGATGTVSNSSCGW